MTDWQRTRNCGELRITDVGSTVTLNGWVNRRRDLGQLIFVDLRDRSGLVQVVFDPEILGREQFSDAESLRSEYVISVQGEVAARPEANPNLATGEIEVRVSRLVILAEAETPPFHIDRADEVDEALRLKYRYLHLRSRELQETIALRHRITAAVRSFLNPGFLEIETPMLIRSTPEGARDYVVPSRVHPGCFYALPQSPQLFKQLLMIAGFERYYQIARCFRDEDLRADRQPEFTQIDVEMSFVDRDDVMNTMEAMILHIFEEVMGIEIASPIPRLTYQEAMDRFGSDKPDTRFGMEIYDLTAELKGSSFRVFADTAASGGVIRGICVKGAAGFTRKQIDTLNEKAQDWGAKGLAWLALEEGQVRSPIAKFLSEEELAAIRRVCGAETGDLILIVAGAYDLVCSVLAGCAWISDGSGADRRRILQPPLGG